jgi:hypothetical protein
VSKQTRKRRRRNNPGGFFPASSTTLTVEVVERLFAAGKAAFGSQGVTQTFLGSVAIHNQVIATDNAIQNIDQMGDAGVSLKEIARLFRESMELKGRELQEGLAGIEVVASEVKKPEKDRNWKSILDGGGKVLDVAGKATDLASKLAPYTPHILALVDAAKHLLK